MIHKKCNIFLAHLWLIYCFNLALAIVKKCQAGQLCPTNSRCFQKSYCRCNDGFTADCSIKTITLSSESNFFNVNKSFSFFQLLPSQMNVKTMFEVSFCNLESQVITVGLQIWFNSGKNDNYAKQNAKQPEQYVKFMSGCTTMFTLYSQFGFQPNGQKQSLIIGIQGNQQARMSLTAYVKSNSDETEFNLSRILMGVGTCTMFLILLLSCYCFWRKRGINEEERLIQMNHMSTSKETIQCFDYLLPSILCSELGVCSDVCSVCLSQIKPQEYVRKTPCEHVFHTACIDAWSMKNLICPLCRTDLDKNTIISMQQQNKKKQQTQWHENLIISEQPGLKKTLIE